MPNLLGRPQQAAPKKVLWVPSSQKDLRKFPKTVKEDVGAALYEAQLGGKSPLAKVLKGFGGASVLEIVSGHNTDTYRAVYTVQFARAIVVLHCFQKKSKHSDETTQADKELIRKRLKDAKEMYTGWLKEQENQ